MGVTYKLKEEIVQSILQLRQGDSSLSCRDISEKIKKQFDVNVSKSSVHDVLKNAQIEMPRGRKPKDKFQIPLEKKIQIKDSLTKTAFLPPEASNVDHLTKIEEPAKLEAEFSQVVELSDSSLEKEILTESIIVGVPIPPPETELSLLPDPVVQNEILKEAPANLPVELPEVIQMPTGQEFQRGDLQEGMGAIFLKAVLWDLGVFNSELIKEMDWPYYLTYTSGIKVFLEDGNSYFIELCLPLQRCILEAVDAIINHQCPLVVDRVSDENLFKSSMEGKFGKRIAKIGIVDQNTHFLAEFDNILDYKVDFLRENRLFVANSEKNVLERAKDLFFTQDIDIKELMDKLLLLKGVELYNKKQLTLELILGNEPVEEELLQKAVERFNALFLRDAQGRAVKLTLERRLI